MYDPNISYHTQKASYREYEKLFDQHYAPVDEPVGLFQRLLRALRPSRAPQPRQSETTRRPMQPVRSTTA